MARARRNRFLNPFGLAFLDVMSCGLGAAVLLFLIIDYNLAEQAQAGGGSEVDVQFLERSIAAQDKQAEDARLQVAQLNRELRNLGEQRVAVIAQEARLSADQSPTISTEELASQVREREKQLQAARKSRQLIERQREARRQYVAGFRVEGQRILILLDRSASMQDVRIATIVRNKFLPAESRQAAYKWRWTLSIFEWLLAHLPEQSQYQVIGFSTAPEVALQRHPGWLPAADEKRMKEVIAAVHDWVPDGGTRLDDALEKAAKMRPSPDAVYLVTDGLPTQGKTWLKRAKVSSEKRLKFFKDATSGIRRPHHVILLPLEGDPAAAGAYWQFATRTGGQFLVPSEDWP